MVRQNANKSASSASSTSSPAERDKRLQLARVLLFDLEQLNNRLSDVQGEMQSLEQIVIARFKQALEEESLSITKTIMLHSRLAYSVALLAKARLEVYDRLSGNVGLYDSNEEMPPEPPSELEPTTKAVVLDFKQKREAEKTCMAAIQLSLSGKEVTRDAVDALLAKGKLAADEEGDTA